MSRKARQAEDDKMARLVSAFRYRTLLDAFGWLTDGYKVA